VAVREPLEKQTSREILRCAPFEAQAKKARPCNRPQERSFARLRMTIVDALRDWRGFSASGSGRLGSRGRAKVRPCNRPQERSFPTRSESPIASAPFEAQGKQDDRSHGRTKESRWMA
jgi:hypothetical protein